MAYLTKIIPKIKYIISNGINFNESINASWSSSRNKCRAVQCSAWLVIIWKCYLDFETIVRRLRQELDCIGIDCYWNPSHLGYSDPDLVVAVAVAAVDSVAIVDFDRLLYMFSRKYWIKSNSSHLQKYLESFDYRVSVYAYMKWLSHDVNFRIVYCDRDHFHLNQMSPMSLMSLNCLNCHSTNDCYCHWKNVSYILWKNQMKSNEYQKIGRNFARFEKSIIEMQTDYL